jgi:hypothetical protein
VEVNKDKVAVYAVSRLVGASQLARVKRHAVPRNIQMFMLFLADSPAKICEVLYSFTFNVCILSQSYQENL